MKISEAAAATRLSADTIRFYEREGLLRPVSRTAQGDREFSAHDLRWLRLFERLRATGMPLAEMRRYAELSHSGASTYASRRQMLETHLQRLEDRQADIDACRALVTDKIATYRGLEREDDQTLV